MIFFLIQFEESSKNEYVSIRKENLTLFNVLTWIIIHHVPTDRSHDYNYDKEDNRRY